MSCEALIIGMAFTMFLPPSLALYPQKERIDLKNIEKELQCKTAEQYLYFNKGL